MYKVGTSRAGKSKYHEVCLIRVLTSLKNYGESVILKKSALYAGGVFRSYWPILFSVEDSVVYLHLDQHGPYSSFEEFPRGHLRDGGGGGNESQARRAGRAETITQQQPEKNIITIISFWQHPAGSMRVEMEWGRRRLSNCYFFLRTC